MAKHTLREWYLATRPWSFPVSAMPVVVTTAFLFWYSRSTGTIEVKWVAAVVALIGIVAVHAAGNLLSDYNDHRTGVDEGVGLLPLVNGSFLPRVWVGGGVWLGLLGRAGGGSTRADSHAASFSTECLVAIMMFRSATFSRQCV